MTNNICTLNVKGLNNKLKRNQLFTYLKQQQISVCLLQETHLPSNNKHIYEDEWGGQAFFSGISSNSAGVCILINPTITPTIIQYEDIVPGRLQAMEINIENKNVTILNIYGPNEDNVILFDKLSSYLSLNNHQSFIIGGDFNTVLDYKIDKKNGREITHKKCNNKLNSILDLHNLVDVWRILNPTKLKYTWHSNTKPPIFCRLDYFIVSDDLLNKCIKCKIKPGYKSDHSIVILTIDFIQQPKGPGYFKLNNTLLLENEYKETIKTNIIETVNINKDANPNTLWELVKGTIRNETIKYASTKKKIQNKKEKKINVRN